MVAYALSPIDLIPDFIPVLGQIDELIILPLGIWLVVQLIPVELMNEHRAAAILAKQFPRSMAGAVAIVLIWIVLAAGAGWLAYRWLWP